VVGEGGRAILSSLFTWMTSLNQWLVLMIVHGEQPVYTHPKGGPPVVSFSIQIGRE